MDGKAFLGEYKETTIRKYPFGSADRFVQPETAEVTFSKSVKGFCELNSSTEGASIAYKRG